MIKMLLGRRFSKGLVSDPLRTYSREKEFIAEIYKDKDLKYALTLCQKIFPQMAFFNYALVLLFPAIAFLTLIFFMLKTFCRSWAQ